MQVLSSNFARPDGAASGTPIVNSGVIRQLQVANTQAGGFSAMVSNTGTISIDNSANAQNDALHTFWVNESGAGVTQNFYDPGHLYMVPPASTLKITASAASDAFSGNVLVSGDLYNYISGSTIALFARGVNTTAWAAMSAYYVALETVGSLTVHKVTAGSNSAKTSLTSVLTNGTAYRVYLIVKDSGANVVVTVRLQRLSDGFYLNSSKAWVAASASDVNAIVWTDTSSVFAGAGKIGTFAFMTSGQTYLWKNIRTTAAP